MGLGRVSDHDRIAILGASRGLGFCLYQTLLRLHPENNYFLSSRKVLDRKPEVSEKTVLLPADFSQVPVGTVLQALKDFEPTRVIYCAGGGPHGEFHSKKWGDHLWAIKTSFLFPAELLHSLVSQNETMPSLKQIVVVGSAIAESQPDPGAASYAAAKHAIRGLITSIQAEQSPVDILLFSPGYMQTGMLPANSWPVMQGRAEDPFVTAKKLIDFIEKNNQR